jgi:hypothetical protein
MGIYSAYINYSAVVYSCQAKQDGICFHPSS